MSSAMELPPEDLGRDDDALEHTTAPVEEGIKSRVTHEIISAESCDPASIRSGEMAVITTKSGTEYVLERSKEGRLTLTNRKGGQVFAVKNRSTTRDMIKKGVRMNLLVVPIDTGVQDVIRTSPVESIKVDKILRERKQRLTDIELT